MRRHGARRGHGARLGEYVATVPQFRNDAHPLGYLEAGASEIDQVATEAKLVRALDQRRLVTSV
jgi:hypothetical protein